MEPEMLPRGPKSAQGGAKGAKMTAKVEKVGVEKCTGKCRENVEKLNEFSTTTILRGDCLRPVHPSEACNVVFLDPPYEEKIAMSSLEALGTAGWIANKGICVIETRANQALRTLPQFEHLDQRQFGAVQLSFLRYRRDPKQLWP